MSQMHDLDMENVLLFIYIAALKYLKETTKFVQEASITLLHHKDP